MSDKKLPTHYELSSIAAQLVKPDRSRLDSPKVVAEALKLWNEVVKQLSEARSSELSNDAHYRKERVGQYAEALKVEKHYMPPLPAEFFSAEPSIGYDDFLEWVVGLSETGDRVKWFRKYLSSLGSQVMDISEFKEKGFTQNQLTEESASAPDSHPLFFHGADDYARGFREWRLTVNKSMEPLPTPHKLSSALYNGKNERDKKAEKNS